MRAIEIQKMPVDGICMLYAAAMCLGWEATLLAKRLGHNGLDVEWPEVFDCRRYRGILLDEVNDVIEPYGYQFGTRNFMPVATNGLSWCRPRPLLDTRTAERRVGSIMESRGILIGQTATGMVHAEAVEYGIRYNPGSVPIEAFQMYHPLLNCITQ